MRAGDIVKSKSTDMEFVVACVYDSHRANAEKRFLVGQNLDYDWHYKSSDFAIVKEATDGDFTRTIWHTIRILARKGTPFADMWLFYALENYIQNKPSHKIPLLQEWYEISELQKAIAKRQLNLAHRILGEH